MLIEVSNLSASIASRVYPNNSLSGQLVQSGGTRDRGINIVSVPTKSGRWQLWICVLCDDWFTGASLASACKDT